MLVRSRQLACKGEYGGDYGGENVISDKIRHAIAKNCFHMHTRVRSAASSWCYVVEVCRIGVFGVTWADGRYVLSDKIRAAYTTSEGSRGRRASAGAVTKLEFVAGFNF